MNKSAVEMKLDGCAYQQLVTQLVSNTDVAHMGCADVSLRKSLSVVFVIHEKNNNIKMNNKHFVFLNHTVYWHRHAFLTYQS